MDVALDANEFLSDPRMQSVRFQTLLAYLRQTESRLLIPKIVWDEVIARYPERISKPYKEAVNNVGTLRNLLLAAKIPKIPELKVEKEIAAMRRKLKTPSPHVKALILGNFSEVSVEEVARRGVERIPPANPQGEELRDVIVWLMVLAHAKKAGAEIAFISHDGHFREGDVLHPKLQDDLEGGKIKLHYYKAIDDFIKAHAPSPRDLTEEEALRLLSMPVVLDLFEIEARRFFPRYWGSETEVDISERKLQFHRAALYDVGGSQFGEMEVLGTLHVTLATTEYPYLNVVGKFDVSKTGVAVIGSPVVSGRWDSLTPPSELSSLKSLAQPIDWKNPAYLNSPYYRTVYPIPSKRKSEAVLSGKMTISFRVVSNKVTKVEVEGLEITKVEERAIESDQTVAFDS
jgi:hypothetical protein